jgi:lysophospholipase L1-like esterase
MILSSALDGSHQSFPTAVCFGDSITRGAYLPEGESYPSVLRRLLPRARIVNAGIPGQTSAQGIARFERDVLSRQPDIVIVIFGTNDSVLTGPGAYRVSPENFSENMQQMIQLSRGRGCRTILGTLLPIHEEPYFERHPQAFYDAENGLKAVLQRYRQATIDVARKQDCRAIDLYQTFAPRLEWIKPAPDGVHPTAEGMKQIALEVQRALAPVIATLQKES